MKNIILCADDFSQNAAISQGIIQLIEHQRINATSCMTNSALWSTISHTLHALHSQTFIGLHFNLTEGTPISPQWKSQYGEQFFSLPELIRKSYVTGINPTVLRAELQAQWDAFRDGMNQEDPDFIDGHQHIHQLPSVANILIDFCKAQRHWNGFVRQTYNGFKDWVSLQAFPKHQLLASLGGMRLKKLLSKNAMAYNSSFSGIIHFNDSQLYSQIFPQFLQKITDNGLIMCHPGLNSKDSSDPLFKHRSFELAYLLSDIFLQDLETYHVSLKSKSNNQ